MATVLHRTWSRVANAHTHTHRSSTTEATATDDPGLFVLAPARRPGRLKAARLAGTVHVLCMHKPVLSRDCGGWSGIPLPLPLPSLCASVLRAVAASPTRMQPLCCSIRCHHAPGGRRARRGSLRSPLTPRTCPPSGARAPATGRARAFLCSGRRVWPITWEEVRWLSILAPPSAEVIHSPAANTKHRFSPKIETGYPAAGPQSAHGLAAMRQTGRRGGLVAVSRALVQEGVVVEGER